jgi:hypothetical protein
MPDRRSTRLIVLAAVAALVAAAPADDPLAAELERWSSFLRTHPANEESWRDLKNATEPVLVRTRQALDDGRRLLALLRLDVVQENLAAAAYVDGRPADQRKDPAAFEAEWKRMGTVLGDDIAPGAATRWAGGQAALARALSESALRQARVYYDASLDYGRSTTPDSGLFYLGAAQARAAFAAFCRGLARPSKDQAPPLRSLEAELDEVEGELLAAYRPPASIDKHREFIAASATLKTARELDGAGLRYGALLRYLQAVQRSAVLRSGTVSKADPERARRLGELDERLAAPGRDHSLGRVFLEAAQADLGAPAEAGPVVAAAVVSDVLPRYLAALEPAPPRPARPAPAVTVTLVRWPYT